MYREFYSKTTEVKNVFKIGVEITGCGKTDLLELN
jgi:hypothetical protein